MSDSANSRFRWNAESVFPERKAWYAECSAATDSIPPLSAYAGTLGQGAARLSEFFSRFEHISRRVGTLYFYATMSQAVDTNDTDAQSMVGQSGALYGKLQASLSFLEPELIAIGKATLDTWTATHTDLKHYAHYLDALFRRQEHIRSTEVEEVLGLVEEVFASADNIHEMLVNADLSFAPIGTNADLILSQSTVEKYIADADRNIRRQAWESFCDAHVSYANTLAATLTTAVKKDVFRARVRRFDTAREAALFDNNIPLSVYDSTIDTFNKNLPVWHRYWKVRKKALKVEKLHHYDIWAPLSSKQPVVPFEQAVEWITSALAPLGKNYTETLRRGCLIERWVDVYPRVGKSAGAFSYGHKGTHPFIMMSYSDDLSSLSTLAHELGHSMHSFHTWKHQPDVYSDYSIFVAEVASNFNQALTRSWLFEHQKDREFQIALIEEAMENFHRYFFIMPTLAKFEHEFHRRVEQGMGITAPELSSLTADLFAEGYGGHLELDREREGSTWAQFSHLYMNYYVFQYATGISAAHALATPILAGDASATRRYLDFLSCGSSRYPVDALKLAGVDMESPLPMQEGFAVLNSLIDRLEELTS